MQSRLSLSVPSPVKLGSTAAGAGRMVGSADGHGMTSAELSDDSGAVICVATGRGVLVSRATGEKPARETGRLAGAGQRYVVVDISVSFLPSPALDQGDLTVSVKQVKSGRRICSVIATMLQSGRGRPGNRRRDRHLIRRSGTTLGRPHGRRVEGHARGWGRAGDGEKTSATACFCVRRV